LSTIHPPDRRAESYWFDHLQFLSISIDFNNVRSSSCREFPWEITLMSSKLGDLLLKENLISQQQLKEALEHQRVSGGRLGNCLIKLGFVTDDEITAILSRQYGVP